MGSNNSVQGSTKGEDDYQSSKTSNGRDPMSLLVCFLLYHLFLFSSFESLFPNSRLMSSESIKLAKRHLDSLKEYFGDVHDDRLLSMAVNPLLATHGSKEVVAMNEEEGGQLVKKSKDLLETAICKMIECMTQESDDEVSNSSGECNFIFLLVNEYHLSH